MYKIITFLKVFYVSFDIHNNLKDKAENNILSPFLKEKMKFSKIKLFT